MLSRILFLTFLLTYTSNLYAGSCCGGGGGSAQIMLGSTQSVFRTSYSNKTILADSSGNSVIQNRESDELETLKTLSMSTSFRLNSLWQAGFNIPLITKTKKINSRWEEEQGLGDIQANTAYEIWPEYSRNQLITQAFLYFQITLPTAPSIFTTKRTDTLDTRGQGHNLYTFGSLLLKKVKNHTITTQFTVTYREPKKFKQNSLSDSSITTKSSFDNELSLAHSYSINNQVSSSLVLSRAYTESKTTSVFIGKDQSSLVYTSSVGMIYSLADWDINITYTDDLLVGPSYNHVLGRSLALGFIKRINL